VIVCSACGDSIVTKAHVKDHAECVKDGIANHAYLNIVELCYNCHYNLFDRGRMGILKSDSLYYFIILNDLNEIEKVQSKVTLNLLDEYVRWKNLKCKSKLWKFLFVK
jgi:hypothetical protein